MWVCLYCVDNFIGLVLIFSLCVLFLHILPLFCMLSLVIIYSLILFADILLSIRTLENEEILY